MRNCIEKVLFYMSAMIAWTIGIAVVFAPVVFLAKAIVETHSILLWILLVVYAMLIISIMIVRTEIEIENEKL